MKLAALAASALVALGSSACHQRVGDGKAAPPDAGPAGRLLASLRADSGAPDELGIDPADVARLVNPSNLPVYSGPTGAVEGTVWVTGDPSPPRPNPPKSKCPEAASLYAKLFREGPADARGARPLADAIVGVNDLPGSSSAFVPARSGSEQITIHGCTLGTRTVALTFGQRLDVLNRGTNLVGPELQPTGVVALMLAPPKGDPVHLYPPKPGRYFLTDALAADAIDADVFVFLFPLHTVTAETGHFRIEGIPAGKRRIFAHLPAIDVGSTADIDVRANETTPLDLTLTYDSSKRAAPTASPAPVPVVR